MSFTEQPNSPCPGTRDLENWGIMGRGVRPGRTFLTFVKWEGVGDCAGDVDGLPSWVLLWKGTKVCEEVKHLNMVASGHVNQNCYRDKTNQRTRAKRKELWTRLTWELSRAQTSVDFWLRWWSRLWYLLCFHCVGECGRGCWPGGNVSCINTMPLPGGGGGTPGHTHTHNETTCSPTWLQLIN